MNPDFAFEQELREKGIRIVAGADEVGRGAFAGPVVSASVIFEKGTVIPDSLVIRDSKKMTSAQRGKSVLWLKNNSYWAVGEATVTEINRFGVATATQMAFRRALKMLSRNSKIDWLVSDAFYINNVRGLPKTKQTPIIHGDGKSLTIAAASIIAKVYRDDLMINLSQKFKNYFWEQNKGYGTSVHRMAIKTHGACRHHRTLFVKNCL